VSDPYSLSSIWTPRLLSVLRIITALVFIEHGTTKLFGFPGTVPAHLVLFPALIAGLIEVFGGLLLLVGLQTRLVAFIMSGEMAVAYFMSHQPRALFPFNNGGELAILFCFVFLYLAAAGAGQWSLDAMRGRA
jgi:putative oxidoreductase